MKRLLLAALLLTNAMMANAIAAEPKASAPSEPHEITVREAVGLSFALRQLDGAASGRLDKDSAAVLDPFRFDSITLMDIAINQAAVDAAVVVYQKRKTSK